MLLSLYKLNYLSKNIFFPLSTIALLCCLFANQSTLGHDFSSE